MSQSNQSSEPAPASAPARAETEPPAVHALLDTLQRDGIEVRRVAGTIGTREYLIDLGKRPPGGVSEAA